MPDREWATLFEVHDRLEAEIIKDALEAQGIPAELFQEGVVHFGYPVTVGPMSKVEICVPSDRLEEAEAWLAAYKDGTLEDDDAEHSDPGDK
jgi:hypothetical protein